MLAPWFSLSLEINVKTIQSWWKCFEPEANLWLYEVTTCEGENEAVYLVVGGADAKVRGDITFIEVIKNSP